MNITEQDDEYLQNDPFNDRLEDLKALRMKKYDGMLWSEYRKILDQPNYDPDEIDEFDNKEEQDYKKKLHNEKLDDEKKVNAIFELAKEKIKNGDKRIQYEILASIIEEQNINIDIMRFPKYNHLIEYIKHRNPFKYGTFIFATSPIETYLRHIKRNLIN